MRQPPCINIKGLHNFNGLVACNIKFYSELFFADPEEVHNFVLHITIIRKYHAAGLVWNENKIFLKQYGLAMTIQSTNA